MRQQGIWNPRGSSFGLPEIRLWGAGGLALDSVSTRFPSLAWRLDSGLHRG